MMDIFATVKVRLLLQFEQLSCQKAMALDPGFCCGTYVNIFFTVKFYMEGTIREIIAYITRKVAKFNAKIIFESCKI